MPDTPSDPCPRTGGMPARLLRQGVQGRLCRASLPSQWRTELAVRTNPCGLRYLQNTRVRIYLDVLHERVAESIHQWGSRSRNQPVSAHLWAGFQRDCEVSNVGTKSVVSWDPGLASRSPPLPPVWRLCMRHASELQARDGQASTLTCTYLSARHVSRRHPARAAHRKQEQERVSRGGPYLCIEDSTPVREAGCSSALSQPRCSASHAVFRYLGAAARLAFLIAGYPGAWRGNAAGCSRSEAARPRPQGARAGPCNNKCR